MIDEKIEIETGIFYDHSLSLIEQSEDAINLFNSIIIDVLTNETYLEGSKFDEFTIDGEQVKRVCLLIFNYTSLTLGTNFKVEYKKRYKYNPSDLNWETVGKRSYLAYERLSSLLIETI